MRRLWLITTALALICSAPAAAATFDMPGDADLAFIGEEYGSYLGFSVAYGDINNDGLQDAIVGEPGWRGGDFNQKGRVLVFWGGENDVDPDLTITAGAGSAQNGWQMGFDVAAGDVNGDGIDDVIYSAVGAMPVGGQTQVGVVMVTYGRGSWATDTITINPYAATPALADVMIWGGGTARALGYRLAAGDLNNDGHDDVIMTSLVLRAENKVWVVYGDDFPSETVLAVVTDYDLQFVGDPDYPGLGMGVGAGDVTGDNIDDLLIGASGYLYVTDDKMLYNGRVYVFYGATGWTEPAAIEVESDPASVVIDGVNDQSNLGWALAVSDLNGDGTGDIAASAPNLYIIGDDKATGGTVYVIYGGSGLPGSIDLNTAANRDITIAGETARMICFGYALSGGDINGDCIGDLLIGSYYQAGNFGTRAYAVYGSDAFPAQHSLAMDGDADQLLNGVGTMDGLGNDVALGDMDGDLLADMLVGAPNSNDAQGAAYVVYSPESNLPPTADAGDDQDADVGDEVTLDGSGSSDPEGHALTYIWTQTDGPTAALEGADTSDPSFTVEECGTFVFELVVNDCLQDSDPDSVTIDVDCPGEDDDEEEIPGLFGTGGCGTL